MKILVKYPTRGRSERFFEGLDTVYNLAAQPDKLYVLVTADLDDAAMFNDYVLEKLKSYRNIVIMYGVSRTKIHAVNRDMDKLEENFPEAADWDIVVNMSDDMRFLAPNWDDIIREQIRIHGKDVLLHFPDQDAGILLATMYIAGRTFYDRFGYIYDPRFKSLWCDNLVMDIARKLGKYVYVDLPHVISHLNPVYGHLERDEMFDRQQSDWGHDEAMYMQIKRNGYELENINTK